MNSNFDNTKKSETLGQRNISRIVWNHAASNSEPFGNSHNQRTDGIIYNIKVQKKSNTHIICGLFCSCDWYSNYSCCTSITGNPGYFRTYNTNTRKTKLYSPRKMGPSHNRQIGYMG